MKQIHANLKIHKNTIAAMIFLYASVTFGQSAIISVRISASKLSAPANGVALKLVGPVNVAPFLGDTTASLSPGTYQVMLQTGQGSYGTFTVSSSLQVTNLTGSLVLSGSTAIDFDLAKLASVSILSGKLSAPASVVAVEIPGVTVSFGPNPTIHLPLSLNGSHYEITPPGRQGSYGAFTVIDTGGQLLPVVTTRADSANALVLSGPTSIDFDLTRLANVTIQQMSTLTVPASQIAMNIVNVTIYLPLSTVVYLPPNRNGSSYDLATRGGHGSYGRFVIVSNDGVLSVAILNDPTSANALILSGMTGLDFDLSKLAMVRVLGSRLGEQGRFVTYGISEASGGAFSGDTITYLPPSKQGATLPYQIGTRGGQGSYGAFTISNTLEIHTDPGGALSVSPEGINFISCKLNNLRITPFNNSQVAVSEAIPYVASVATILLPNGTYNVIFRDSGGDVLKPMVLRSPAPSTLPTNSSGTIEFVP